jgi:hypothetical protein
MNLKQRLRLDDRAEVHWYGPTVADWQSWRPYGAPGAVLVSLLIAVRTYQQLRAKKPTASGQQRLLNQVSNFMPLIVMPR